MAARLRVLVRSDRTARWFHVRASLSFFLAVETKTRDLSRRRRPIRAQAHWFYEDFCADAPNSKLPHLNMKAFAEKLFAVSTLLAPLRAKMSKLFDEFRSYKGQIPVCGCILLNAAQTHFVLVRNWKGTSWTFPKGKLNEGEAGAVCAVREVHEETGYDAAAHAAAAASPHPAASDDAMIEMFFGDQRWRVFFDRSFSHSFVPVGWVVMVASLRHTAPSACPPPPP